MVSWARTIFVKIIYTLIHIADKFASFFGYKIFEIAHENIFKGLPEEAIKEAQSPDIVKPFRLFIDGAKVDSQLTGLSRFYQIQYLKDILNKRVAIKRSIRENPDILKTQIMKPVFIVGLPRTGSTLLHRLMCQDDQFRFIYYWEIINPYPAGRPENWRECERYLKAQHFSEMRRFVGQADCDLSHELRVDQPEECLHMLTRNFLHHQYFTCLKAFTGLADWYYNIDRAEIADIYRFHKQQLQLIGYQGLDHQTYLFKSVVHLLSLDALLDVFPDARFVFTHRPLSAAVPSYCSLIEMSTKGWGPQDAGYGKRILRVLAEFVNRGVKTMKRYKTLPEDERPFFNVEYQDLITDPIETVKSIYKKYGFTLTDETEEKMRRYLDDNVQHKHGKHKYSMMQYGLTEQDILDNFGPYLEYFKNKTKYKLI